MRIIAGKYKRTPILTLEGEDITRPTRDMVKEALFSTLYIYSDILNKISMYNNTNNFILSFQLNNYSRNSYLLKKVLIVDKKTKSIIYDIPYHVSNGNAFSFSLDDINLQNKYYNYLVQIELVK